MIRNWTIMISRTWPPPGLVVSWSVVASSILPHDSVFHDFALHSPGLPDFCTISAPFLHHESQFKTLLRSLRFNHPQQIIPDDISGKFKFRSRLVTFGHLPQANPPCSTHFPFTVHRLQPAAPRLLLQAISVTINWSSQPLTEGLRR